MNEQEAKQLLIPDKLKVGYQKREGTYTGKLAFVVYFDGKGVLRKEKSWEGWRDKKIAADEYNNEPTEGFVLNKSGGGQRHSYGWNARNEFIRVYDPRGFEFEISLPNLLFILRETDCSRGKGLEGKFVYAWDGQELVLLPAGSEDYKHSKNYTALQTQGVKFKDMVPGTTFTTKKQEDLTFLGKFDYYFMCEPDSYRAAKKDASGVTKKFVFWSEKDKKFVFLKELKSIAVLKSDVVHPDFADLVAKYGKSENGSPVTKLFLKEVAGKKKDQNYGYDNESWFYEESPGVFVECTTRFKYNQGYTNEVEYVQTTGKYTIEKGVLVKRPFNTVAYAPGVAPDRYRHYGYGNAQGVWHEPTTHRLFATTESGGKVRVTYNSFQKDR